MRRMISLVGLVLLLVLCIVACNGDKPNGPTQPDLKNYRALFYGQGLTDKLYIYHTVSGKLDSVLGGPQPRSVVVASRDGKRLYYDTNNSVLVVDSDSLDVIIELPYHASSGIVESHDGSLLALTGDTIWVLRTDDYSLFFSDTISVAGPQFSSDGRILYCGMATPSVEVYSVDLSSITFPRRIDTIGTKGIRQVIPVPGKNQLVLFSVPAYTETFELYDADLDSIVMSETYAPGSGRACVTPDGRYAFFGNPGDPFTKTGPSLIYKVDLRSHQIEEISTVPAADSLTFYEFPVQSLTVTPDSRILVIQIYPWRFRLAVYDIERNEFIQSLGLPESVCTAASISAPE